MNNTQQTKISITKKLENGRRYEQLASLYHNRQSAATLEYHVQHQGFT
jgi:hypothetical protein